MNIKQKLVVAGLIEGYSLGEIAEVLARWDEPAEDESET